MLIRERIINHESLITNYASEETFMDGSKLEQIIDDWSKYLQSKEYAREVRFFMAQIPESLLPHPKEKIEEALNVYIRHFERIGKHELAQTYLNTTVVLSTFVNDEVAIKNLMVDV